jgi:hypothetical protein
MANSKGIVRGKFTLVKDLTETQRYQCGKTGIQKAVKDFTEADFAKMKEAGNPNIIETVKEPKGSK